VWLIKPIVIAMVLFGIFLISGHVATWMFSLTGSIWGSAVVFGISMVTSVISLLCVESWSWILDLIG
jgi:hypothetical protein